MFMEFVAAVSCFVIFKEYSFFSKSLLKASYFEKLLKLAGTTLFISLFFISEFYKFLLAKS